MLIESKEGNTQQMLKNDNKLFINVQKKVSEKCTIEIWKRENRK